MVSRDYVSAPISESLGLGGVIAGLVADLEALRAGSITVPDAMARSMLAKQIFNGVRIYMNGTKYLSDAARPSLPAESSASPSTEGSERETPAEPLPPLNTDGETASVADTLTPSGRPASHSQSEGEP